METHKINGIELLMPQVPKEAINIKIAGVLTTVLKWEIPNTEGIYTLEHRALFKSCTILGTCWREGNHKFFHNGFDPAELGFADFEFQDWLRSKGITIPEGQKRVLIKIN